jgi:S1-C subfamily serine protease
VPDSPADHAGIKSGDLILKIGSHEIASATDIQGLMTIDLIDHETEAVVLRDGHQHQVTVRPRLLRVE